MQSIYQKDNINYGSLIDSAIKNRIDTIKRERDYREEMIKGIQQGIGVLGRYADEKWGGNLSDAEIEREKLIKENEDIYNNYSDYMSESNSTGTDYWTNQYQDYKPNVIEQSRVENPEGNAYALPGDRNANQSDYFNYIQAMNGIYNHDNEFDGVL